MNTRRFHRPANRLGKNIHVAPHHSATSVSCVCRFLLPKCASFPPSRRFFFLATSLTGCSDRQRRRLPCWLTGLHDDLSGNCHVNVTYIMTSISSSASAAVGYVIISLARWAAVRLNIILHRKLLPMTVSLLQNKNRIQEVNYYDKSRCGNVDNTIFTFIRLMIMIHFVSSASLTLRSHGALEI